MDIIKPSLIFKLNKKYPDVAEFIKFSIVGAGGTTVDFGIYALLTRVAGVYYLYATAISVMLAILNNFLLNKFWTFKKGGSGRIKSEYLKFLTVSLVNYFLNIGITWYLIEYSGVSKLMSGNGDFLAKAAAIAVVLFSNYFGNKYWTFRG